MCPQKSSPTSLAASTNQQQLADKIKPICQLCSKAIFHEHALTWGWWGWGYTLYRALKAQLLYFVKVQSTPINGHPRGRTGLPPSQESQSLAGTPTWGGAPSIPSTPAHVWATAISSAQTDRGQGHKMARAFCPGTFKPNTHVTCSKKQTPKHPTPRPANLVTHMFLRNS